MTPKRDLIGRTRGKCKPASAGTHLMMMTLSIYQLKLMFEWGGGCVWCDNDIAFKHFGVGPIEGRLPLSPQIRDQLEVLTAWHNQALNWDAPREPGPWTADEYHRFDHAAQQMLQMIQVALGTDFVIHYLPL